MVPRGLFQIEAGQERETCSILWDSSHYEPPQFLSTCPPYQVFHFIESFTINFEYLQSMTITSIVFPLIAFDIN